MIWGKTVISTLSSCYIGMHVTVMWLPCGCHVTVTWWHHVHSIMWQSCDLPPPVWSLQGWSIRDPWPWCLCGLQVQWLAQEDLPSKEEARRYKWGESQPDDLLCALNGHLVCVCTCVCACACVCSPWLNILGFPIPDSQLLSYACMYVLYRGRLKQDLINLFFIYHNTLATAKYEECHFPFTHSGECTSCFTSTALQIYEQWCNGILL